MYREYCVVVTAPSLKRFGFGFQSRTSHECSNPSVLSQLGVTITAYVVLRPSVRQSSGQALVMHYFKEKKNICKFVMKLNIYF